MGLVNLAACAVVIEFVMIASFTPMNTSDGMSPNGEALSMEGVVAAVVMVVLLMVMLVMNATVGERDTR